MPEPFSEPPSLSELRKKLLDRILLLTIPLAAVTAAAGSLVEIQSARYNPQVIACYFGILAVLTATALMRKLGHTVRGWVFLSSLYAVAMSRLWFVGLSSTVSLFLLAFIVFAGIFFGRRAGLLAFACALVTLASVALLVFGGSLQYDAPYQALALNKAFWLAQSLPLIFISGAAVISVTMLLQGLNDNVDEGRRLLAQLHAEIEERRNTETALRESEEGFRLLFDMAPDICFICSPRGVFIDGNRSAESLLGVPKEHMIGKNFFDLGMISTDQLSMAYHNLALNETGQDTGPTEFSIRIAEGVTVPLEVRAHPFTHRGEDMVLCIARDVSRRKQQEKALIESEARYRSLVEQPHDLVMRIDPKATVTYVNMAAESMLGYTPAEIVGKNGNMLIHPDSISQIYESLDRRLRGGMGTAPFVQEIQLLRKDGSVFAGELRSSPILNGEGQIVEIQGMLRDISQRKRSEATEAIHRSLLESVASGGKVEDIMLFLTRQLEILNPHQLYSVLLLEPASSRLFHGAAPSLSKPYIEAINGMNIGPGRGCCGNTAFTRMRTIAEDILTHPYWEAFREIAADAGLRACWSEPILSSAGGILGTLATYRRTPGPPTPEDLRLAETTAHFLSLAIMRNRAEEALQNSEALYHSLVENLPQSIFRKDLEGRFTFANGSFCTTVNLPLERILGRTDAEITSPELALKYQKDDQRVMETLTPLHTVEENHSAEHGKRTVEVVKTPLLDAGGRVVGIQGIFWDITERKRAEEQRQEMERQVQHVQKLESLGVLAGGIAHDFNNLLMVILGHASLLDSELPASSPHRTGLAEIENASRRAADLCRQMLAYSGKGNFMLESVDLGELVSEIVQLLRASISKKAVLRLDLAERLPAIEVDPTQIRQVLMNLITNASEAIGEKGGYITVSTGATEVDLSNAEEGPLQFALAPGQYLYLEVEDTGCGMDEATRERIFEPFFTTKFTGRGLGMAAVLGIVRGHSGAIQLQSQQGKGSNFRVLLPVSACIESGSEVQPQRQQQKAWSGTGMALVVDDEGTLRTLGKIMLEKLGYTVLTASDGRQALEIFAAQRDTIKLVLLDLTMPRMDGEETLRELRSLDRDVAVVLTSGYTEFEIERRFAGQGLTGFVEKPYNLDKLRAALSRALPVPRGTRATSPDDGSSPTASHTS